MTTLTIRMPDEKANRLREMARQRGISLNKLMEELSTLSLAEFDAETRFRARAARGTAGEGLSILDNLDERFSANAEDS
ncbi:ribbon-helix-helix protein, CopG family [Luteolibacter flavescens]|uniref:Ribbon-helix-helix protein, CopG family n=1 Tax=Luteolibacter flavescens TaxID=1859460 RepID=A0ABT3FX21_9BACT|nr:ribbon-helix-helix protein, CopG family [Luteolibacter flavescens]MCW1887779.1 ribbon-helix-helix protein, CopG family [Luteolibacter flavescens]